jgi:hypothetical protein
MLSFYAFRDSNADKKLVYIAPVDGFSEVHIRPLTESEEMNKVTMTTHIQLYVVMGGET